MKKIGIVVPVYNAEAYLEQCVNSILNQTYRNIELVLVDDGSTDNSGKICDRYAIADDRVKVIHQSNRGKLPSRYAGITELESDYATFVDADDWIEVDTYEKMSKYMDEDIDMISFRIIRYFDETYQYTSQNNYASGTYDRDMIKEKIFPTMIWNMQKDSFGLDPSLCNKLVKRNLLLDALRKASNLEISYGDDVAVTYVLVKRIHTLIITEESLYYHRQRERGKLAEYLSERQYYKKLFSLYEYLSEQFQEDEDAIRQIDYFYSSSTKYHLRKYGEKEQEVHFLFPFDKVEVNKKIILYGASVLGQIYYQQFNQLNYGTIVAWVDRNYETYKNWGVKNIECLKEIKNYDYIVIAVRNEETVQLIKDNLKKMDVDDKKIVWSIR